MSRETVRRSRLFGEGSAHATTRRSAPRSVLRMTHRGWTRCVLSWRCTLKAGAPEELVIADIAGDDVDAAIFVCGIAIDYLGTT